MRPPERLAAFVRAALLAGQDRAAIAAALKAEGWTGAEVRAALGAWSDAPFPVPVPRPQSHVSAREAFTSGLMFVALSMTVWHLTSLSFTLIDIWIPDPDDRFPRQAARGPVTWSVATLVVFFPIFLLLDMQALRGRARHPARRPSPVRRWFAQAAMFLAVLVLLGDLIVLIYSFLNGDMTARFLVKSGLVAVVAGTVWLYFSPAEEVADAA